MMFVVGRCWDELRQGGIAGLKDTVDRLKAKGITVYVLGQSPMFAFDAAVLDYRRAGQRADRSSAWYLSFDPADNERLRAASGQASFINPLASFCRAPTSDSSPSDGWL